MVIANTSARSGKEIKHSGFNEINHHQGAMADMNYHEKVEMTRYRPL